jgi:hypothetical protein
MAKFGPNFGPPEPKIYRPGPKIFGPVFAKIVNLAKNGQILVKIDINTLSRKIDKVLI